LRDELTGEMVEVRPKVVVNAGGAWIDRVNAKIAENTHFIGGTKGSHLIIDNDELYRATNGKMIYYENADGRICIFFPLLDKVLVGSTDIRIDNPDEARTTDADIDYMLESVHQVFPGIHIDRSQIVFHFVGVRPLPSSGSSSTGQISRDHSIQELPPDSQRPYPVYSLVGGKWTTFRAFGEQAADVVLKRISRSRRTTTKDLRIGGGKRYPADIDRWIQTQAKSSGLSTARVRKLLERYGTRATEVIAAQREDQPLEHLPSYSVGEIQFMVACERVLQLEDILLRRTTIALQGQATIPLLEELAAVLAVPLGWTPDEQVRQVRRTAQILQSRHGVTLAQPTPEGVLS
jgi:glycerol-3-phosphate dehydrogenase